MQVCTICGKEFTAVQATINKGYAKFCSRYCFRIYKSQNADTSHSRAKGGRREDLDNRYFRSGWEANYARYLNWLVSLREIKDWEYEVDTFHFRKIKRGVMFYTPDFKITNNDDSIEYHEIKGWMDPGSATKLKRMSKYYPNIKVILIDREAYKGLARDVRNLIPEWE